MGNTPTITYAQEVKRTKDKNNETGIYRSAECTSSLCSADPSHTSTWKVFDNSTKKNPQAPFLGSRPLTADGKRGPYEWQSYGQVHQQARNVGSCLIEKKLCPLVHFEDEEFSQATDLRIVGILLRNCPEWYVTEFAASSQDITLVPLYETLGASSLDHIVLLTKMKTMVVGSANFRSAMNASKASSYLDTFIVVDDITEEQIKEAKEEGVTLYPFSEFADRDATLSPSPALDKLKINTLCFTSGTTGTPKGVILTHENVVTCSYTGTRYGPLNTYMDYGLHEDDIHISYLPLSHVFERLVSSVMYTLGARIGCYSGDMLKLLDDVQALNPSMFVSVPRLFNRINDKILAGVEEKGIIAKTLFNLGIEAKKTKFQNTASRTSTMWDSILFNKFQGMLGNNLRVMISGGAPLDPTVHAIIQGCFSTPLLQGYGMSETFGPAFLCMLNDNTIGHVGGVFASVEFKLASVPDLGYSVTDDPPRGELLLRGHSVTPGYFRNSQANKDNFKKGWLHTGDVCELTPYNGVKIIDRKKNLFKLSQGEYVAPEKIENTLANSPFVNQIFVHGVTTASFLVGIVVVDNDAALRWAKNNQISEMTLENICKRDDFRKHLLKNLNDIGNTAGLMGFEKLKNLLPISYEFTVDNNLVTPTSKLHRIIAKKHFKSELELLYKQGPQEF